MLLLSGCQRKTYVRYCETNLFHPTLKIDNFSFIRLYMSEMETFFFLSEKCHSADFKHIADDRKKLQRCEEMTDILIDDYR